MDVVRLDLAYDGSGFSGWARQPGLRTVQGTLEDALHLVLRRVPKLSAAGRTDAGVHARGQVVSFECDEMNPERLGRKLNSILAPEVVITRATRAPARFDARHSATAREYRYRMRTSELPDPFQARYEWHRPRLGGLTRMRAAARLLEGEHDFASFCRRPQAGGTVRRLDRLRVARSGDLVEVGARADGFLHQMVRSLVGTLVAVGDGRMEPEAMPGVLRARSRGAAGPVAPPHGLTLVRVTYGVRGRRPQGARPEKGTR